MLKIKKKIRKYHQIIKIFENNTEITAKNYIKTGDHNLKSEEKIFIMYYGPFYDLRFCVYCF